MSSTIKPDADIIKEIEEQRPRVPVGLLSHAEKGRLIERGVVGLYRWYVARSQATRNWNPDKDFDWRTFRTDHSPQMNTILEGFFAVEQYVPDYVTAGMRIIRESYGRSHFHLRWGSEEEKHADLWLNTLLFSRFRTPKWIEEYKETLRNTEWKLPWDDALHMFFYPVFQERATQLSYLNTSVIAHGKSDKPELAHDADPVLAHVSQTIAVDEAAHYNFFLEIARLYLYYYPAQTLEAIADVIRYFAMPAQDIIPNYQHFAEAIYKAGIYGLRQNAHDMLPAVLNNLSIVGRRALNEGLKRFRRVPDEHGNLRDTAIFETIDYQAIEDAVKRMFKKIEDYEHEIGFAGIQPTQFVPSGLVA